MARVRRDGRLVLNAACLREMGAASHAQLQWDADSNRVGIKATTAGDPLGFRLSRSTSQGTITSREFIDSHDLPADLKLRLSREGDMLVSQSLAPEICVRFDPDDGSVTMDDDVAILAWSDHPEHGNGWTLWYYEDLRYRAGRWQSEGLRGSDHFIGGDLTDLDYAVRSARRWLILWLSDEEPPADHDG